MTFSHTSRLPWIPTTFWTLTKSFNNMGQGFLDRGACSLSAPWINVSILSCHSSYNLIESCWMTGMTTIGTRAWAKWAFLHLYCFQFHLLYIHTSFTLTTFSLGFQHQLTFRGGDTCDISSNMDYDDEADWFGELQRLAAHPDTPKPRTTRKEQLWSKHLVDWPLKSQNKEWVSWEVEERRVLRWLW